MKRILVKGVETAINGRIYNISGISLRISTDKLEIFRNLERFAAKGPVEIDLAIRTKACTEIEKPEGSLLIDQEVKWVNLSQGKYATSIYVCENDTERILCRADINQDWSKAEISYLSFNRTAEVIVSGFLTEMIFRNRIIFNNGVVIHASAVLHEGLGIIFTAPSGTGKSTQAMLWAKYMDARILNDDRPALRLLDGKTYVHGTPWSGKKTLYSNDGAELKAIILLEQGPENMIRPLLPAAACACVMPRCFLPYYNLNIMEKCLDTLGKILVNVPVCRLSCKPDRGAVNLVNQYLCAGFVNLSAAKI